MLAYESVPRSNKVKGSAVPVELSYPIDDCPAEGQPVGTELDDFTYFDSSYCTGQLSWTLFCRRHRDDPLSRTNTENAECGKHEFCVQRYGAHDNSDFSYWRRSLSSRQNNESEPGQRNAVAWCYSELQPEPLPSALERLQQLRDDEQFSSAQNGHSNGYGI